MNKTSKYFLAFLVFAIAGVLYAGFVGRQQILQRKDDYIVYNEIQTSIAKEEGLQDSLEKLDELQKKYKLQPSFRHNGKTIRAIDYVADFWVKYSDGSERVYDTKGGMVDPSAKIKRKLMYYIYPDLDYVWITHTKSTGWLDWDENEAVKRATKKEGKKDGN